jgi:hypothetical protein
MSRALILGILFAGVLMNSSGAQEKNRPDASGPPYPAGSGITFQSDYSCPSDREFVHLRNGRSKPRNLIERLLGNDACRH